MMNFSKAIKAVPVLSSATGSADRNGTTIDTQGFHGCAFAVHFGTIAASAVTSIKAQGGAESDLSDAADFENTSISVAADDDNQVFIIDLGHSQYRYVRVVVDKDATNDTTESAVAYLYDADTEPVTQPADVTSEFHHAPVSGTA